MKTFNCLLFMMQNQSDVGNDRTNITMQEIQKEMFKQTFSSKSVSTKSYMSIVEQHLSEEIKIDDASAILKPIIDLQSVITQFTDKQRKMVFKKTLSLFASQLPVHDPMIKNHLKELTFFDGILKTEGGKIFYLLHSILEMLVEHKNALLKWKTLERSNDTISRGVALSTSNTLEKTLQSRINELKAVRKIHPNNAQLRATETIYTEFLKSPDSTNFAIQQTLSIFQPNELKSLTSEEYQTLENVGEVINSSIRIKKAEVFFESIAANMKAHYDNLLIKSVMKLPKLISKEQLSSITEIVINYVLDTSYSISSTKMKQPIQQKTYFYKLPLYEFVTASKIKVHPAFEDTDEQLNNLEKLLKKIKGNIPPN